MRENKIICDKCGKNCESCDNFYNLYLRTYYSKPNKKYLYIAADLCNSCEKSFMKMYKSWLKRN